MVRKFYKLEWHHIFGPFAFHKKSSGSNSMPLYIVHKWIPLSHSFIYLKSNFKIWMPHNIFWTCMDLKFEHNLMFTIILENMKLHYQLLCKNMFFLDSIYYLGRRKQAIKNPIIAIIIQTKDTKWKIVVLEKFRRKNHQIWS